MLLLVRVRPYRDDPWEALEFRLGLEPQTSRMSELGHVWMPPLMQGFSEPFGRVIECGHVSDLFVRR